MSDRADHAPEVMKEWQTLDALLCRFEPLGKSRAEGSPMFAEN